MCCCSCTAEPPESDVTLCKAFQYCAESTKSIEINYENMDGEKILTKVNFQLDPAVRRGEGGGGDYCVDWRWLCTRMT